MDESKSNTSYVSEESDNAGSTEYEGDIVDGELSGNFFKYTSPHKSVHVKISNSSTATSSFHREQCEQQDKRWKIHVRLEPKLSKNHFVQHIRNRRQLKLKRKWKSKNIKKVKCQAKSDTSESSEDEEYAQKVPSSATLSDANSFSVNYENKKKSEQSLQECSENTEAEVNNEIESNHVVATKGKFDIDEDERSKNTATMVVANSDSKEITMEKSEVDRSVVGSENTDG